MSNFKFTDVFKFDDMIDGFVGKYLGGKPGDLEYIIPESAWKELNTFPRAKEPAVKF